MLYIILLLFCYHASFLQVFSSYSMFFKVVQFFGARFWFSVLFLDISISLLIRYKYNTSAWCIIYWLQDQPILFLAMCTFLNSTIYCHYLQRPADIIRRKRPFAVWFPYSLIERLWCQLQQSIKLGHMVDQSEKLKKLLQGALVNHLQQVCFTLKTSFLRLNLLSLLRLISLLFLILSLKWIQMMWCLLQSSRYCQFSNLLASID